MIFGNILLFFAVFTSMSTRVNLDAACPSNQIYYSRCSPCQPTCENLNPICSTVCQPGCGCPKGLIWNGQRCIVLHQCACPSNQIYYSGCLPCQPTCENLNPVCLAVCQPGCGCPKGLIWNGRRCIGSDQCDISKCIDLGYDCGPNGMCVNNAGSYSCYCDTGYNMNGVTDPLTCVDINECETDGVCHANAYCMNTNGSYTCTCMDGFTGDGTSCTGTTTTSSITTTTSFTTTASGLRHCGGIPLLLVLGVVSVLMGVDF